MGHHSPLSFETCLYALPTKGFVRPATFTDASVRSEQIRKINLELNREGLAVCRMNDTCRADLGKVIETGYPLDIRSLVLIQLAKTVNQDQVPGAVAEFGVFQGWFARRIRKLFPDRSFYLFDTFEGFPPEQMAADMEKYSAKPADFSKTSIEETLKRIGGNPDLVIVKKGIFPASAKDIHEQFAFVSLDVDLYQPTCDGLEFFYARLAPGGFILIHDYGISRWRGVKEGVHKFCQKKKIAMITMPDTCESCVIAKPRCFEKPFPNFPQTCFIRIYSLFVKQYASPDYYEKLRVDPSDYFAASKHPANKLLKKVLTVFGPAPVHTDFSMACLRKKMQGK
jgi:O-methyltransferase